MTSRYDPARNSHPEVEAGLAKRIEEMEIQLGRTLDTDELLLFEAGFFACLVFIQGDQESGKKITFI